MTNKSGIGAEGRKSRGLNPDAAPIQLSVDVAPGPAVVDAKKASTAPNGPELDSTGAGGVLKDHSFALDYIDTRGRAWRGEFKCHALTYREKIQVGLIRARMSGGVPPEMLDITTSNLLEALAHLSVAVDGAPPWAKKLEDVHSVGAVLAIYREVRNHEDRFHGAGPTEAGPTDDEGPGDDDAEGMAPAYQKSSGFV